MLIRTPLIAIAATTLLASTAGAAVLTSVKDTYVDSRDVDLLSSMNFGSEEVVESVTSQNNSASSTGSRIAFLTFDLSSITSPVTAATLDLYAIFGRDNREIDAYAITDETFDSYDESSITYNSLVASGRIPDANNGAALSGESRLGDIFSVEEITIGSNDTDRSDGDEPFRLVENGVLSLVDFVNADTNGLLTIAIHHSDTNGNLYRFATRETTDPDAFAPTLTLTVVPEPASAAAIGLLGLVGLRRRR